MAQTIKQRSKSEKSMRRSADLLLRVYRNNDFLAAKAVAKSTLKPRTHSGLSFAPCPVAGQDVRCPKSVQADLPPPSPPAEKAAAASQDQAGQASTGDRAWYRHRVAHGIGHDCRTDITLRRERKSPAILREVEDFGD